MRWLSLMLLVLIAWFAWALATLPPESAALRVPPPPPGGPPVVRGAYHIHSTVSDGTGSAEEISAAAARAGLRFVILTDHGDGLGPPTPPRYIGAVLCIEAVEISTSGGHYVALGMAPPPYPLGGEARDVVDDVKRLGGFGVAAHPDSGKRELRWDDWDAPIDALEWFNADSQWRDERRWRLLPTILQYPLRPAEAVASLFDRPDDLLHRWDALTARRRVVGLAAADAHARMGLGGKTDPYDELVYVKAPSYEAMFRAFSLRVELREPFSGDPARDAGGLVAAIRDGRVYAAFDSVAGPASLAFSAASGGVEARQGDVLAIDGPVRLRAATNGPPETSLRLLRNGEVVSRTRGPALEWTGNRPGAYRIEAYVPGAPGDPPLPWILSNPVYVGMGEPAAAPDAGPPPEALLVWPSGSWRIEKDERSSGRVETSGSGEFIRHTLHFELGREGSSPFVALATTDVGALHDASRLAFRAASAHPMRLSVQVRLVDDAVERRWQRSIHLSPDPREIIVRFADMRTVGTGAREAFAPARIHSLLFVVDSVHTKPGGGGVAWIEGLRTER
ncbi:MAG: CehA/McbA family metallohydrolase [Vicinamibacterales bacterium]